MAFCWKVLLCHTEDQQHPAAAEVSAQACRPRIGKHAWATRRAMVNVHSDLEILKEFKHKDRSKQGVGPHATQSDHDSEVELERGMIPRFGTWWRKTFCIHFHGGYLCVFSRDSFVDHLTYLCFREGEPPEQNGLICASKWSGNPPRGVYRSHLPSIRDW